MTLNDREEETWLRNQFGKFEYFWIGFNDINIEGNWEWVSGELVTYTNWCSGEPNNFRDEDAAIMNWAHGGGFGDCWNDIPITGKVRGIVEITSEAKPDPLPAAIATGAFAGASAIVSAASSEAVAASGAAKSVGRSLIGRLRPEVDFEVEKEANIKRRIRKSRELFSLVGAVIVVGSALAYVELGTFEELIGLLTKAIVSAFTILSVSYVARVAVAHHRKAMIQYKLWFLGIFMLFVSTLLKAPFGTPGEVRVQRGTLRRAKAEIGLSAILAVIATSGLLYALLRIGLPTEMGVYYGLTLAAASAVPVKPLAGHGIYQQNKKLSGALLILCYYLFFLYLFADTPLFALVGSLLSVLASALLVVLLLYRKPRGKIAQVREK